MDKSNISTLLISHFETLLEATRLLCLHVYDDLLSYPLWIEEEGKFVHNRSKLVYALKQMTRLSQVASRETWSCPGAVGCTEKTIELIQTVNTLKSEFKLLIQDYKKLHHQKTTKEVQELLAKHGYSGLKLKQVYRHICYINYHPDRIAWTKGKAYSNKILTPIAARQALLEIGQGQHIDIQLAKLDLLKPNERLVKRIAMKPYWVVNITYRDGTETHHQKIATSLPLFYLVKKRKKQPVVCFAKPSRRDTNLVRSDKKIEDKPFLESIHAYRYKKGQQHMNEMCDS